MTYFHTEVLHSEECSEQLLNTISNIYDEVKRCKVNSCCMEIQRDVNRETFVGNFSWKKYMLTLPVFATIDFKIDYTELDKNCINIDVDNIKSLNIYFDHIKNTLLKNNVRCIISKSHKFGQKNIIVKIRIELYEDSLYQKL